MAGSARTAESGWLPSTSRIIKASVLLGCRGLTLQAAPWQLQDLMDDVHFERNGNELAAPGLYLDMPAWAYHVFDMR